MLTWLSRLTFFLVLGWMAVNTPGFQGHEGVGTSLGELLGTGVAMAVAPIFSPHLGFVPVILAIVSAALAGGWQGLWQGVIFVLLVKPKPAVTLDENGVRAWSTLGLALSVIANLLAWCLLGYACQSFGVYDRSRYFGILATLRLYAVVPLVWGALFATLGADAMARSIGLHRPLGGPWQSVGIAVLGWALFGANLAADLVLMRMDLTLGATQQVSGIWWPAFGGVTPRHVLESAGTVALLAILASLAADRLRCGGLVARAKRQWSSGRFAYACFPAGLLAGALYLTWADRQADLFGAEDRAREIAGIALVPALLGWLLSLAGLKAARRREQIHRS